MRKFERLGIIKNHSFRDWSSLYDDKGKVLGDKLLKLEAIDVPELYKDENNNEHGITEDDKYLHISFNLVEYMYNDKRLSSKALSIFYLIRKWSNNSKQEKKAWMNINTIKEFLGYGNDTVTSIIIGVASG